MNWRSLLYIAVTSAILATGLLPVFAQSQRYPTAREMQRLRILFRQQIRAIQNDEGRAEYIRDRRSRAEVQNRESFVRNWSRVEPALAPFLGSWSGYEETLHIYPSNIRGRACIVITGEGHGIFMTGSISNGQIRYSNQKVLFIEGNYMGTATIENNKPSMQVEFPLNSPTPLVGIAQLREYMEPSEYSIIRQQFNAAGCTASLPQDIQITTGRSPATSGSRQELVASNLGCTRNLRTILGQSAPDYCTSADAYSGIIFDNVKPSTRNADGSIKLEMTVLNRGSADGFVEVYDSGGNLVQIEVIESSSPPTDLIRNINPFDERSFPAYFFSRYPVGDLRRGLKRQDINVTIPAGGYAKVTKYGNISSRYNAAMLALELSQAAKGDPEFAKSETVKKFIKGFAEEAFLAPDSKAVINIFKSSPSLQAQFNMDVIDPNKLAKVLQELVEYSVKIEKDPSKNPFIGAFQDVFLDGATIGLENALNLLLPGLGTFARGVRKGGNYINTLARAADLYYSIASGEKATVTIRDASTTGAR